MTPILTGVIASGISGHLTPPWSPEGAYDALATVTLTTSATTISFTGIPNTYKHLQIRMTSLTTTSAIQPLMRFNSDSTANYSRHSLYGDGGGAATYGLASVNQFVVGGLVVGMDTTYPYACIIDVLDYTSTSKYKTVRSLSGVDKNGSGEIGLHSGVWMSSSNTVSSISIISGGTYNTNSTFALYGVK